MNRRTALRGMGGAAIALPFLDIMMPSRAARAQDRRPGVGKNGRPQRFILINTLSGQGMSWFDNTGGPDGIGTLGPVMGAMEKHGHKSDLILIDGINNLAAMNDPGLTSGHDAAASITTCVAVGGQQTPRGPSIDQAIAKAIAGDTKFKTGIQLSIVGPINRADYLSVGPAAPLDPISDPQKTFARLFADFQTDPLVFERAKAQRKSILDNVAENYQQFVTKLGGHDKIKLQTHLDAVRELEIRIGNTPTVSSGVCAKPAMPGKFVPSKDDPGGFIFKGRANMDLVAMAFACDLTRVASLDWNNVDTSGGPLAPWIGPGVLWHDLTHGDPKGAQWNKGSAFMVDFIGAGFIDRLKAISDGPGSVWDNTLLYWTTECGAGNHNMDRNTILVAGSAGGYLKTNQRMVLAPGRGGRGHGDLFVSFLNAMGVPAATFGAPQHCKGPLPGLAAA